MLKLKMPAQKIGANFENLVFDSIAKATNPHYRRDILHYCYSPKTGADLHFFYKNKEYTLIKGYYIGGHQTDLAIVDNEMLELITNGALEAEIGERKSGYLMTIECKDYETNIKAKFGTDLVAKNYFLKPNKSAIIKGKDINHFNWPGNFAAACTETIEYSPLVGESILKKLNDERITPQVNEPVFEIFNKKLSEHIKGRKHYSGNTRLEEILMNDFRTEQFIVNLKNFVPIPQAPNPAVIDYPGVVLSKDELYFTGFLKDVSLNDARHLMGYCLMAQAKGIIYYLGELTRNAEEYISSHNDIIKAKKITD